MDDRQHLQTRHGSTTRAVKATLVAASVLAASSQAQEPISTGSALEEVVVTAQKKEETLQESALSITSVSGAAIAESGIKDPLEIQNKLPGVAFQAANTPVMVIRGVGTYNNQPGVDSAVAYVIDGTYLSHHPALPPILFDLRSVEAVRGPQGTLYGRNANGGALNISTNGPVLGQYRAAAAVTAGNYSAMGTELMFNAPVGETTAFRVALATDHHDPYFDDGSQGASNFAGRARLLLQPSEALDFLLTVDHARKRHQGQGTAYCPPYSAYPACDAAPWRPYEGYGNAERGRFEIENTGAYAEINFHADFGTITSLTSFRKYDVKNLWVWDFVDYEPDNDNQFITQELRLASAADAPFDWVIGGFYSRESLNASEYYAFFGVPALDFRWNDARSTSKAIFGQLTYPLAQTLKVTGGLRYTDETKTQFGDATVYDATGTIPNTVATGSSNNEGRLTWKVGLDYDLLPASKIYAIASDGFKSGGVNQVPPGLGLTTSYNPETVTAFQIGTKNRFHEGRVQVNAEAFHYDYEGYQQYSQESDPTGHFPAVFYITVDSQKATFYGGEVEASFLVAEAGQLDLSATLLHATFDEFVVGTIDNTGNEVQGAPKYTLSAAYQHVLALGNGGQLRGRIGTRYVTGHFVANNNAPGSFQGSYRKTDASLTYTTPGNRWSVTAFVRNLEDEAVMAAYADPISRGGDNGFLEAPRTLGVTLRWSLD